MVKWQTLRGSNFAIPSFGRLTKVQALTSASASALASALAWVTLKVYHQVSLFDGQSTVRQAILYTDRSSYFDSQWVSTVKEKLSLLLYKYETILLFGHLKLYYFKSLLFFVISCS